MSDDVADDMSQVETRAEIKAEIKVDAEVESLPLARRVALLSGRDFWSTESVTGGDGAVAVDSFVLTDGPHGVRRQPDDADHLGIGGSLPATCFPTASLLGATWDEALIRDVGAALGREGRAQGVGVLLGPGLNIKRHPAGGRNFEYFSEDPILGGHLAAAMVQGIQSEGIGACLKHFVANNHESYRMICDVIVDERTLRELYLRGFEIAVERGRPWAVMTSYNLVNGEYVSDSQRLVNDVLCTEWGFDGLVVTDWGGTNDRVAAVRAGVDLEMPSSGGTHDADVVRAVEAGELPEELVNARVRAVARLASEVAVERSRRDTTGTFDEVAHDRLARRVAAAGTVLLSNDGTLPIDPAADVALIGAFADAPREQGAGSSHVVPTRADTARRAFERRTTGGLRYAPVYDPSTGRSDPTAIADAARLAAEVDVPVVFVGLPAIAEAEGFDREHLSMPPALDELVGAVCTANPRTVVVLSNGAPVLMPWADGPAAIVEGYLAGQAGSTAIVDVLVGDAEPGGRLAETFPMSDDFPSAANFPGEPRQVQYREGPYVGYRFNTTSEVEPRFAFGHGLSYTSFEWGEPTVFGDGTDVTVEVEIRNTGARRGSDVVQLYVRTPGSAVDRPDRELQAFAKVHLDPGAAQLVTLRLDRRSFAHYDVDAADWRVEAGERTLLLAASSTDIRSQISVQIDGDRDVTPWAGPSGPSYVASDDRFESMLGRSIPRPVPTLPFTINTVVDELAATSLGRATQRGLLKIAERQMEAAIDADDPVLRKLSERMIREAPLRFLIAMSGGTGSLQAMDGLTKMLSTLRISSRRTADDDPDDHTAVPAGSADGGR